MEVREALDSILMPKSIAVIGASKDPFKWGNMLLAAIMTGEENNRFNIVNDDAVYLPIVEAKMAFKKGGETDGPIRLIHLQTWFHDMQ